MARSAGAAMRAILLADVVGSTELRSRLGDEQADELRRVHDALLGSAVTAYGGQVLRWTGDGLKASFPTASASVAAAIEMHRAVARYGRRPEAVAPFRLRIGLSAGEVVYEDDDDHGVAVIEAARLEALAEPGETLATDLVRLLGQRRGDADFEPAGTHELKGLDERVSVVRVVDTAQDLASRPLPRALKADGRFPLVGRGEEVATGLRSWREVRSGGTALALVAGQPGIGKSRVVAQIAQRAHADGATVLAGTCDADVEVPYQPFAQSFEEASAGDEQLARALTDGVGPLGPLFPARRAGSSDDGPAARYGLFEAVVALVARLGSERPVVLVLDDLHWAAPPTVQLLRHLVGNAAPGSLLVLATFRPEAVGPGHPLHELLAELHRLPAATRIDLEPLGVSAVADLVAARAPTAPPHAVEDFARRVFTQAAGSPFFVCELLDHLSATGQLERLAHGETAEALPIPDSVRDVVGQRLARLPEGADALLATAAVIGLGFDLELLAALTKRPEEDVLELLESVGQTSLVHEAGAGRFAFDHAIVRNTILHRMSASRQALNHRKVAEALESLRRPDPDELWHHWNLGGVADKAIAALEVAARRDLDALAYESAAERFQTMVDHFERDAHADEPSLARAWLGLGRALRAMGKLVYLEAVEQAGRLGRRLHDGDLVAEAAVASIWPGSFFHTAGEVQVGLVELSEAALAMVPADDPRRARLLSTLAGHLTFDPDRQRRIELIAEAEALARRADDAELLGTVLVAEHLCLWAPTTFDRRARIAHEVTAAAQASGDLDLTFFGGFFTAFGAAERGDLATARTELLALAPTVTASQNFFFGFLVDRLLVSMDVFCAAPDAQQRIDALAARYADSHADTGGTWAIQTGALAMQSGEFGDLVPTVRATMHESDASAVWTAALAMALLGAGDRNGAGEVLDHRVEPPLDYFWLAYQLGMAHVAVDLGRGDDVARSFELLLPFRGQLAMTASGSLCFGLVSTVLGQLALASGAPTEAVDLLEEAVAHADAMQAPYEATRARRLLAAALQAAPPGEDTKHRAAALLGEAASLAATHGFEGERQLL
jgi:class 3 adenylate cyclase/tetratricopeptide (TPR) repeat protein